MYSFGEVVESLKLPCRCQSLGCYDVFPYYSKLKHEQYCQAYSCPYGGSECSITGDIPTLATHLEDDHNGETHDRYMYNHQYVEANPHEVENSTWMLTVSLCFSDLDYDLYMIFNISYYHSVTLSDG